MINTNGAINLSSQWSQRETDSNNANNSVTDAGQLTYTKQYISGSSTGTINQVFNQLSTLSSGSSLNLNLTGLTQSILGNSVIKSFTGICSLTMRNLSTNPGYHININLTSSSGFKDIFGGPTGVIVLNPNSAIHINTAGSPYVVNTNSKHILIQDGGSGATFELSILGRS